MLRKFFVFLFISSVCLIMLFYADFATYYITTKKYINYYSFEDVKENYFNFYNSVLHIKNKNELKKLYIDGIDKENKSFYREVVNENSNLPSILLFGCSYVYGYKIDDDKIFSQILGNYTKRPVYNRAKDGLGVSAMLFQLQNENFYKMIKEPEYVIYTYIFDHTRRMFITSVPFIDYYYDIFYKLENDKLKLRKFVNKIYSIEVLKNYFYLKYNKSTDDKIINLFKAQILESNKLIKQHWRNAKFVILVYTNDIRPFDIIEDELKKQGIIIIYRKDIAPFDDYDEKYALSKDDGHPNNNAWEYITPKLMEAISKN